MHRRGHFGSQRNNMYGNTGYGGPHVTYSRSNPCCNALCGVLFGVILLAGSTVTLWYNEGAAVQTAQSLEEGLALVTHVPSYEVNPENNGKLIHVHGPLESLPVLEDNELGIQLPAAHLEKVVEMYQWLEEKHTRRDKMPDGSTREETYFTYRLGWSSSRINSDNFRMAEGHMRNPRSWPLSSKVDRARGLRLGPHGEFPLNSDQISRLVTPKEVTPNELLFQLSGEDHKYEQLAGGDSAGGGGKKPSRTKRREVETGVSKDSKSAAVARQRYETALQKHGLQVYGRALQSGHPGHPTVGDIRVKFKVSQPKYASVVGLQARNGGIAKFHAPSGDVYDLIEEGELGPRAMFAHAQDAANMRTWALRFFGWLLMFIGLALLTSAPLSVLEIIPIFGGIAASLLGPVTCCASFFVSIAISLVVIATGWFWYRPLITLGLITAALIPTFFSYRDISAHRPRTMNNNSNLQAEEKVAPMPQKRRLPTAPVSSSRSSEEPPPYVYGTEKSD